MKDHIACLEKETIRVWKEGNIHELIIGGRTIQCPLHKSHKPKSTENSFANLMFAGKTKATLDLLSHADNRGVLHLHDPSDPSNPDSPSVRETLID